MNLQTTPPPLSSRELIWQVKHTPTMPEFVPVTPAQTPKQPAPSVEAVPDYAAMRRAEIACLTERMRIARTQRRALALFARIAANPERMQLFGANVLPPTINEKAELPNGDVY